MTALNNMKVSGSCFYKFMKITAQTYTSISKQIPAGRLCQMAIQVVRYKKAPRKTKSAGSFINDGKGEVL